MSDNNPLLSVIVPIYNTEKYLKRCIRSILSQKHQNIEVILVNDGSTDGSGDACDEFTQRYPDKIRVIHKENTGQGVARNVGIDISKGEYIAFVDSDDYICYEMYSKMMSLAQAHDHDIVVCDLLYFGNKCKKGKLQKAVSTESFDLQQYIMNGPHFASPCTKLFHRTVFENIRFPAIAFEDLSVIPVVMSNARSIGYVPEPLYHYCFREGSTIGKVKDKKTLDILKAFEMSIENINLQYREEMIYSNAKDLLSSIKGLRKHFSSNFVNFVEDHKEWFENCKYIKDDIKVSGILDYINYEVSENHQYKISVVMAVYNAELFLAEAVDSLIAQDIGFEDSIQLILVNDGSTDGSGELCEGYANKYPNNIVAFNKENGGVSSARNMGLKHVRGKYVNFMDADDKVSASTFKKTFAFLEGNRKKTDVVAIPMTFFEKTTAPHPLNTKFAKGARIIDLSKEPSMIQHSVASAFYKSEQACNIDFDEDLVHGEDIKFNQMILLRKRKLGVIKSANYFYRKRIDSNAILDTWQNNPKAYISYAKHFAVETLELGNFDHKQDYKSPGFIQNAVMADLKWKIKQDFIPNGVLSDDETLEYRTLIAQSVGYIEDKIILDQKDIYIEHKVNVLSKKYGRLELNKLDDDVQILANGRVICKIANSTFFIDFITYNNNVLCFEGYAMCPNCTKDEPLALTLSANEEIYLPRYIERNNDKYSMGELIFRSIGFVFEVPIEDDNELYNIFFSLVYRGVSIKKKNIRFGKFSPIGPELAYGHYYKDKRVLTHSNSDFYFRRCGLKGRYYWESNLIKELKEKNVDKETIKLRVLALIGKHLKKKSLWIISDRVDCADDNGEAFYKYLVEKKPRDIEYYFMISEDSPDFKRISKIGKVLPYRSYKHKLKFLLADHVISSHLYAQETVKDENTIFRDLINDQNFIFLQHGITKDDQSSTLSKYNRNMNLFITAVKPEWESIAHGRYFFDEKNVVLTGFPRYDGLYNNNNKIITIMPTWRRHLFSSILEGVWQILPNGFVSDFYKFYTALLNDERLLAAAEKHNYTIAYFPHPNMRPIAERIFWDDSTGYKDVYAQSSLVVTDYSSAVFDFAYLRKPVLYCQFDRDTFFENHSYKEGYFDYDTMGFGEVEHDLDGIVNRIIEYMENDCELKEKYRERIDSFFAYSDKNNCQRVFDAIVNYE